MEYNDFIPFVQHYQRRKKMDRRRIVDLKMFHDGKIGDIETCLDDIGLKQVQIAYWERKQHEILNDGSGSSDDMGCQKRIDALEEEQSKIADSIARIDNRGTARPRMVSMYLKDLCNAKMSPEVMKLMCNRLVLLAALPIYRMRVSNRTNLVKQFVNVDSLQYC